VGIFEKWAAGIILFYIKTGEKGLSPIQDIWFLGKIANLRFISRKERKDIAKTRAGTQRVTLSLCHFVTLSPNLQ
jgi:hypothetical protein